MHKRETCIKCRSRLERSSPLPFEKKFSFMFGSNFLSFTCTCTHIVYKRSSWELPWDLKWVNETYKLKRSIVLYVQALTVRFFTLDEEKVKSLHFFSAFLSQRFVAFYIQRIALGIISVALLSYIVTTTFCLTKIYLTLRPSQQVQEQDQDHQGQRKDCPQHCGYKWHYWLVISHSV